VSTDGVGKTTQAKANRRCQLLARSEEKLSPFARTVQTPSHPFPGRNKGEIIPAPGTLPAHGKAPRTVRSGTALPRVSTHDRFCKSHRPVLSNQPRGPCKREGEGFDGQLTRSPPVEENLSGGQNQANAERPGRAG